MADIEGRAFMSNSPVVAILLDHFGSGGVERVACHIANGLQRRGFQVELLVVSDEGPVRKLLHDGVRVRVLPVRGIWRRLPRGGRLLAAVPALVRYLREHRPAVLHSPGNHTHLAAGLAVRRARYGGLFIPKITNPIIKQGMGQWQRGLRRWIYARLFKTADKVIVLSQQAVAKAGMIHPELAAKAIFLPNPYVSEAMVARGTTSRDAVPLVLSVGRLSRQKDYPTLLRAMGLLKERQWRLRICGIGPDKAALQSLAAELGIAERLELPGFIADVVPHYSAATVMVLSSRWEDLPATLIEAMACGCPVISTASSPAVEQLLEAGALAPVPVGDVVALSAAIQQALDGKLPVVARQTMLAYGIEASSDAHARLISDLMQRAAARHVE